MINEMKRQAFAWIELRAVIAILGVLAALLPPALSKAKSAAHKAVYVNNQRQIGLAWQLDATDNEGHLVPVLMLDPWTPPFPDRDSGSLLANAHWRDILCAFYLDGNVELFACSAHAKKSAKAIACVRARHQDIWLSELRGGNPSGGAKWEKEWNWGCQQNRSGIRSP